MANPTARIFATERLACIDNPLAFVSGLAAAMVPEFAVVVSVARAGRTPAVFTQRAVGKSRNVDD
jgi:hypothetical protein